MVSMNTKHNIFLWALYDFANSIVVMVFLLYFAQWVVVEQGLPDLHFNLAFTFSAILLLFTVPVVGFLLDTRLRRITCLRYTSLAMTILYGASALFAVMGNSYAALGCFACALYAYLLSFTFYTPLLYDIATPKTRGKVSGIGVAAHYVGQFSGLLLVLPFATGAVTLFGASARAETLVPSVVLFVFFALPMMLWFREPKKELTQFKFGEQFVLLHTATKTLLYTPGIALFLLAYFLFNDAVLTVANNFPIFLEQVWGVSDTTKTFILLGIFITSALGGILSGVMADRFGYKRTLLFILAGWLVIFPLVGLVRDFTIFVVMTTLIGFWFGSIWTVSRAVIAYLAPEKSHNLAFGYFGLVERASSLLGPIVWGLVVGSMVHMGSERYRIALFVLTIFIALGLLVLWRVKSDRPKKLREDEVSATSPTSAV